MIPCKNAALVGVLGAPNFDVGGVIRPPTWWSLLGVLARKLGIASVVRGVVAAKVDVDANADLVQRYEVRALPSIVALQGWA